MCQRRQDTALQVEPTHSTWFASRLQPFKARSGLGNPIKVILWTLWRWNSESAFLFSALWYVEERWFEWTFRGCVLLFFISNTEIEMSVERLWNGSGIGNPTHPEKSLSRCHYKSHIYWPMIEHEPPWWGLATNLPHPLMTKIDANDFKIQFLPCREHGPSALQRPAVVILYRLIARKGQSYVQ
jgi:hypothetical protein